VSECAAQERNDMGIDKMFGVGNALSPLGSEVSDGAMLVRRGRENVAVTKDSDRSAMARALVGHPSACVDEVDIWEDKMRGPHGTRMVRITAAVPLEYTVLRVVVGDDDRDMAPLTGNAQTIVNVARMITGESDAAAVAKKLSAHYVTDEYDVATAFGACGGAMMDRDLRRRIAEAFGFCEPPPESWVVPGAWAFCDMMGPKGMPFEVFEVLEVDGDDVVVGDHVKSNTHAENQTHRVALGIFKKAYKYFDTDNAPRKPRERDVERGFAVADASGRISWAKPHPIHNIGKILGVASSITVYGVTTEGPFDICVGGQSIRIRRLPATHREMAKLDDLRRSRTPDVIEELQIWDFVDGSCHVVAVDESSDGAPKVVVLSGRWPSHDSRWSETTLREQAVCAGIIAHVGPGDVPRAVLVGEVYADPSQPPNSRDSCVTITGVLPGAMVSYSSGLTCNAMRASEVSKWTRIARVKPDGCSHCGRQYIVPRGNFCGPECDLVVNSDAHWSNYGGRFANRGHDRTSMSDVLKASESIRDDAASELPRLSDTNLPANPFSFNLEARAKSVQMVNSTKDFIEKSAKSAIVGNYSTICFIPPSGEIPSAQDVSLEVARATCDMILKDPANTWANMLRSLGDKQLLAAVPSAKTVEDARRHLHRADFYVDRAALTKTLTGMFEPREPGRLLRAPSHDDVLYCFFGIVVYETIRATDRDVAKERAIAACNINKERPLAMEAVDTYIKLRNQRT